MCASHPRELPNKTNKRCCGLLKKGGQNHEQSSSMDTWTHQCRPISKNFNGLVHMDTSVLTDQQKLQYTRMQGHTSVDRPVKSQWTRIPGHISVDRSVKTYIHQLCPDNVPRAMVLWDGCRAKVKGIHAGGTSWWWWWWYVYECVNNFLLCTSSTFQWLSHLPLQSPFIHL